MVDHQSIINAFRSLLVNHVFDQAGSTSERFAQKRFAKKMEIPNDELSKQRKQKCWDDWISFDQSLKLPKLLPSRWYKARLLCHKILEDFRLADVSFTDGSEYLSTHGCNSIEAKLCNSKWTCQRSNFDLWAETVRSHRALRMAMRKRLERHIRKSHEWDSTRSFHRESWEMFSHLPYRDRVNACFKRGLAHVTFILEGNRFSTVRKNNEKDRPICVESLPNMLVQRRIGIGIRDCLFKHGVDLLTLAQQHRRLVSNLANATIDLKNASDSIHLLLVKFMLPRKVFRLIDDSRSYCTMGLDNQIHMINKVSSMGNGFTFELMSLIFYCLGQQHSPDFSVFGDDMIIPKDKAKDLIRDLEPCGFVVNLDKSFIDGPFRESCGANYDEVEGYIESYDFEYPNSIHDCSVIFNKVSSLARKYPSFQYLRMLLLRSVPTALRGPSLLAEWRADEAFDPLNFPPYFATGKPGLKSVGHVQVRVVNRFFELVQIPEPRLRFFYGFVFDPELRSTTRRVISQSRNWAKYFMYLHGCSVTKDTLKDRGTWVSKLYFTDGHRSFRYCDAVEHIRSMYD